MLGPLIWSALRVAGRVKIRGVLTPANSGGYGVSARKPSSQSDGKFVSARLQDTLGAIALVTLVPPANTSNQ